MKHFSLIFSSFIQEIEKKNFLCINQFLNEIIGKFYKKTKIEKLYKGKLFIAVNDSRILHELKLLSPIILDKLNKKIKEQLEKKEICFNEEIFEIKFFFKNKQNLI